MKNPCRECDNLTGDKNGDACRDCHDRLEYIRYLADPDHFVPRARPTQKLKTTAGDLTMEKNMQQQTEAAGKTKVCARCGQERPVSEFTKKKQKKDGLESYCKSCKAKMEKQYREAAGQARAEIKKKIANKKSAKQAPVKDWPAPEVGPGPKNISQITLDFTNYPELYQKLADQAAEEFRTPEMQAMKLIYDQV